MAEKRIEGRHHASPRQYSRQRPTLPHRYQCSTIGPGGLYFRVRNGNGCSPSGIATGNVAICATRMSAPDLPDRV